jgi:DNA-binding transcriptional regulator YiaG
MRSTFCPVKPRELTAIREELGLNQAGLAAELGVDQSTVSNWEAGKHAVRPPMEKLLRRFLEDHRASRRTAVPA